MGFGAVSASAGMRSVGLCRAAVGGVRAPVRPLCGPGVPPVPIVSHCVQGSPQHPFPTRTPGEEVLAWGGQAANRRKFKRREIDRAENSAGEHEPRGE